MRLAVLVLAAGCGRIGFQALDDAGSASDAPTSDGAPELSGMFAQVPLPEGGTFTYLAFDATRSTVYASSLYGTVSRSVDGVSWTPCAGQPLGPISVDSDGTVYGGGADDVYASTDQCATWHPTNAGLQARVLCAVHGTIYAGTVNGISAYASGVWAAQVTPVDGNTVTSIVSDPAGTVMFATSDAGTVRRVGAGAWTTITDLASDDYNALAIAGSTNTDHAYALDRVLMGTTWASTNGGVNFTASPYLNGGRAIAIDPTNQLHVVAGAFDDFAVTTNAFASTTTNLRGAMGPAQVFAVDFTASGGLVAAAGTGMYTSPSSTSPVWTLHTAGLNAWTIANIVTTPTDRYLASLSGILHSSAGGAFAVQNNMIAIDLEVYAVLALDGGATMFACGRQIRKSTDGGASWPVAYDLGGADGEDSFALAANGTRVFAGTVYNVVRSDPPYTTWTDVAPGGGSHLIQAIVVAGTTIWAGGDGLYKSTNNGNSFQTATAPPISAISALAAFSDGSLAAVTPLGLYKSKTAVTAWTQITIPGMPYAEVIDADEWVVSGLAGVFASSDFGATWTAVPGLETRWPSALAIDVATGDLLVGTSGSGLWRAPFPR